MRQDKPHDVNDVIEAFDCLPDGVRCYVTLDDYDPPVRFEVYRGMTYVQLRRAFQEATDRRDIDVMRGFIEKLIGRS